MAVYFEIRGKEAPLTWCKSHKANTTNLNISVKEELQKRYWLPMSVLSKKTWLFNLN